MERKNAAQGLTHPLTMEQRNALITRWLKEHGRWIIQRLQRRYGVQSHDAEDMLQHALLQASRHLSKGGEPPTSIRGWLWVTARHAAVDVLDRQNRQNKAWKKFAESGRVRTAVDPRDESKQIAFSEAMMTVIELLPQSQKSVVKLRYCEGFSQAEIARCLGISPSAVTGSLARAMKNMRKQLVKIETDILP